MIARLLRDLLLVHLPTALVVGAAWWQLAPAVQYTLFAGRPFPADELQTDQVVGGDGTFAVLAAAAGALCAAVMLLRRHDGPALPVGLAVAGVLASGVAWWVGVALGPGRLDDLVAAAADGEVVVSGPELQAWGSLLVWPIVAVAVAFAATWLSAGDRPKEPSEQT